MVLPRLKGVTNMQLGQLTFGEFIGAAVVVMLLIGIYNTIMTAVKNYLDAKKRHDAPVDELKERIDAHDKMLSNDKRRIEEIEALVKHTREESAMTLRGVRALLSHELNGNSDDKMKECYDSIDDYLINKK